MGGDLTRHTLARLWTRAHLLYDPSTADPYELVSALGEGEMDQVLTRRRDVASTPLLVREIIRAHVLDQAPVEGHTSRQLLQDSLKRLMRLATFLNLDSLPADAVRRLVAETRAQSRMTLAGAA